MTFAAVPALRDAPALAAQWLPKILSADYDPAVAPLAAKRGLTIGIFNKAEELEGIQIGLLNHAGNNRGMLRWLPLINAHF